MQQGRAYAPPVLSYRIFGDVHPADAMRLDDSPARLDGEFIFKRFANRSFAK